MKGDLIDERQLSPSQGFENETVSSNFDCGPGWPKPSRGVEPHLFQPLRNQGRSFFFDPIAQPGLARTALSRKRENDSERIVLWLPRRILRLSHFPRRGNPVYAGTRGKWTACIKQSIAEPSRITSFLTRPPTGSLRVSRDAPRHAAIVATRGNSLLMATKDTLRPSGLTWKESAARESIAVLLRLNYEL